MPESKAWEHIRPRFERMYRNLMRHRERYVRAWIASTGLHPQDCVLVERDNGDGTRTIYVKPREQRDA